MHCRSRYLWALGALFAFVALLVFDGRPNVVLDGAGAIYVPPAPNRLVKAVPVVPRLQSHFDRCTHALRLPVSRSHSGSFAPVKERSVLRARLKRSTAHSVAVLHQASHKAVS